MATRIIPHLAAALVMTCISHVALANGCPLSECDYGDPQYQAAYAKYKTSFDAIAKCTNSAITPYLRALSGLAILYPRFGIAYQSLQNEIKGAVDAWSANTAARAAAHKADEAKAEAAFDASARSFVVPAADAANPLAADLDVQNHVYNDPSYIAAEAAAQADNDPDNAANIAAADAAEHIEEERVNDAHQRFEDRILGTAEPEALEFYNLYQLAVRKRIKSCGTSPPMPEPPRK